MSGDPPPVPVRWKSKLRSSCDLCGTAKLKCDRGQPECGRCVSYDMPCIYGISRKIGKPPRSKRRPNLPQTSNDQSNQRDPDQPSDKLESSSCSSIFSGGTGTSSGDIVRDQDRGLVSSVTDVPSTSDIDIMKGNTNTHGLVVNLNHEIDDFFSFTTAEYMAHDLSALDFSSLDFTTLDPGKWDHLSDPGLSPNLPYGPKSTSTLDSSELGSHLSLSLPTLHQSHADGSPNRDKASMSPLSIGNRGHDCAQKAYGILANLSFNNITRPYSTPEEGVVSTRATTSGAPIEIPVDHVLCVNREASEQLARLLQQPSCSCSKSPHLALLYASIISRILTSYQQGAGCMQSASWNPATMTLEPASHHVSPIGSASCSGSAPESTEGTTTLSQSAGHAATPTNMAIGTFNVDDLHVQTALKIQLLLGEMRRAGWLIEQFISSHSAGDQCMSDKPTFGGVDSLYISLDSWLKNEHSRIANMMRLKLRELNT